MFKDAALEPVYNYFNVWQWDNIWIKNKISVIMAVQKEKFMSLMDIRRLHRMPNAYVRKFC